MYRCTPTQTCMHTCYTHAHEYIHAERLWLLIKVPAEYHLKHLKWTLRVHTLLTVWWGRAWVVRTVLLWLHLNSVFLQKYISSWYSLCSCCYFGLFCVGIMLSVFLSLGVFTFQFLKIGHLLNVTLGIREWASVLRPQAFWTNCG